MYPLPLAVDIQGSAITVADTTTSWRVRRQTGGRPGPVLGPDGRALKVPLDATVHDLRGYGCGPGTYRLDPIDEKERPTGPAAFAYVEPDPAEAPPPAATSAGSRDAPSSAIDGLVRVMEAMQRAQADQNKTLLQIVLGLVDKSADRTVDGLAAIRQALRIEDELTDAINRRNEQAQAAIPEPVVVQPTPQAEKPMTDRILEFASAAAEVATRFGFNPAEILPKIVLGMGGPSGPQAPAAPANDTQEPAATPAPEPPAAVADEPDALRQSPPAVRAKVQAIWRELSREERSEASKLIKALPPALLKQVETGLVSMSVADALAWVRRQIASRAAPPAANTETGGPSASAAVG